MPKYKVTWTETTTRDWEDTVEASHPIGYDVKPLRRKP